MIEVSDCRDCRSAYTKKINFHIMETPSGNLEEKVERSIQVCSPRCAMIWFLENVRKQEKEDLLHYMQENTLREINRYKSGDLRLKLYTIRTVEGLRRRLRQCKSEQNLKSLVKKKLRQIGRHKKTPAI